MPTLDLMDMTEDPPVRTASVTLTDEGKFNYDGDGVKAIFANYVGHFPNEQIFHNFTGWSNGYVRLQLKGESGV